MPKKSRVRPLMESQHVKLSETVLKSSRQQFCHIFDQSEKNSVRKTCFLVVSEIVRLFVNILTPDEKCSLSIKVSF